MGGYVQMDKDLEDDPRVSALADHILDYIQSLGVPPILRDTLRPVMRDAALGSLYRLWRHGDTHLKRHDRLHEALHHLAEVTGLPVTILRGFPQQWLVEHDDGTIELPDYSTKNTLLNKDQRRSQGRDRTAKYRARKRLREQECDASQGVTGDTSQRHSRVTTGPGPRSGPGPLPTYPGPGPQTEEKRESLSPPRAPLASAQGHLAARAAVAERSESKSPGSEHVRAPNAHGSRRIAAKEAADTRKTLQELEAAAVELAQRTGSGPRQISQVLDDHRATPEQVQAWLDAGSEGKLTEDPAP